MYENLIKLYLNVKEPQPFKIRFFFHMDHLTLIP